jgi:ribosome-associated protein
VTGPAGGDLFVPRRAWLPAGLVVPAAELDERFSRSSGPGGQSVNTTDSRVELRWALASSSAVDDEQRSRLFAGLGDRIVDGAVVVVASEQRSQLLNRQAARERLAELIAQAIAPPPPPRRPTRPSRSKRAERVAGKRHRGQLKANRRRPESE